MKWRGIAYRRELGLVLGDNGEWKTRNEEKERREGFIEEFVSGDRKRSTESTEMRNGAHKGEVLVLGISTWSN